MIDDLQDKLKVKYIEKVALILLDFDLLDEGLKENIDWDRLILLDD